ncbi:hypothetical protein AMTRI_Chr11g98840 [Amborella trichopoda]
MASAVEPALTDVGKRLSKSQLNKDSLIKLLKKAVSGLQELGQAPSLQSVLEPISDSLVRHNLFQHKDKDVRLLVAVCFSEIFRILAPEISYSDDTLREIFQLFISIFKDLDDTSSPYFTKRVNILDIVARVRCCVLMLDIGCDDLVLEMFNVFFSVLREDHPQSVFQGFCSIVTLIIDESGEVSQPLLDVILRNLLKGKFQKRIVLKEKKKSLPFASFRLSVSAIQNCAAKLEPSVRRFLTSSILDSGPTGSELQGSYHEIIFEIFQCAPQMLLSVIPNLIQELLTEHVDVRIKAVRLLGRIFALPGHHAAHEYHQLFVEFLKRFSDKSAEVRLIAVECAKGCFMANPSGPETLEIVAALKGRLLDFDDKVRMQVVNVICDIAKVSPRCIPSELIMDASERLRDKKVVVRKNAMHKLLDLYREYCKQCSVGVLTLDDSFEKIPSRILTLCYDKDCKEFRPQGMELIFGEDLFPVSLPVEERTKHWISLFSFFQMPQKKAFESMLSQKWRLQKEMRLYLALRQEAKENCNEELNQKILASFKAMSTSFVDPSKMEECFQKLHQMKDNNIFKAMQQLLDEVTCVETAQTIREGLLEKIGKQHSHYDFLRILSLKCSHNLFSGKLVQCILLEFLSCGTAANQTARVSCIDLLLIVANFFPLLLRGSEELFVRLLTENDGPSKDKLLLLLTKAGPVMHIKFSTLYPILRELGLEGTRLEAKYSISALASLNADSSEQAFSHLYKELVESLNAGRINPTMLQSLGCIAQYSVLLFKTYEDQIMKLIFQKLFQMDAFEMLQEQSAGHDNSICGSHCELKVCGLKTLVKSYLPYKGARDDLNIKGLLSILLKLLQYGNISEEVLSSESDKAHVRLAAAKSVARLARRWDWHISPQLFHLTVQRAQDSSDYVRRLFLGKIHKLLKEHAIPNKYACSFALASSDCLKHIRDDSAKYLAGFIEEYRREAQKRQASAIQDLEGATMMNFPEYVLVFLVHVLAHDPGFPDQDSEDEDVYTRFCSPLVLFLKALITPDLVDNSKDGCDNVSYIVSIFSAIKKAEDAADKSLTSRLCILSDIGIHVTKAFGHNTSSAQTPRLVYLPASFYRVSEDAKTEKGDVNHLSDYLIDGKLIEKIFNGSGSCSAQECSLLPNDRKNTSKTLLSWKQAESLLSEVEEERDNSVRHAKGNFVKSNQQVNPKGKRKGAPSPISEQLLFAGSADHKKLKQSSKNIESGVLKKKLVPLTSSITANRSTTSSVISEKEAGNLNGIFRLRKGKKVIGETSSEALKFCESKRNRPFKFKELKDVDELVGQRIKLWSPFDKCFYIGIVNEFDHESQTHKISYDNGEIERLCLTNECWERINNEESNGLLSTESKDHHRSSFIATEVSTMGETESSHAHEIVLDFNLSSDVSDEELDNSGEDNMVCVPSSSDKAEEDISKVDSEVTAGKREPGRRVRKPGASTTTTSVSEVTNIGLRRSRRRRN